MCEEHFRLHEKVDVGNLKGSTVGAVLFRKPTGISTVLSWPRRDQTNDGGSPEVQSFVERHSWGRPVLMACVWDATPVGFACCCLSDRKLVIRLPVG